MTSLLQVHAVLFDLDGTFADTAPDLANALNRTLDAFGEPPLPYETIRPFASRGGIGLIEIGFGMAPREPGFEERHRHLLAVYQANLCADTYVFDGTARLIDHLESSGRIWGIVTNKPAWLTDPLMTELGYAARAATVISGDTCSQRKPHPEPLLHACRVLDVSPEQTLYVGDARRDIDAGRAAGCLTAAARFGYIESDDDPTTWNADFMLNDSAELIPLLGIGEHAAAD